MRQDKDGAETLEKSRAAALEDYLRVSLPGFEGPLTLTKLAGGHSNLTYLVEAKSGAFVLKCEPPGNKARSAHDMTREYRMLAGISPYYPLAPRPVLLCEDSAVIGG